MTSVAFEGERRLIVFRLVVPAVKIFVLSATGAPVALVKRSGFDIMNPRF